jgi:hypothetical protein
MDFLVPPASGWGSGACLPSSLFFLFLIRVCQTFFKWMLNFAWPWWKHALLLFGVYAGVILGSSSANQYSTSHVLICFQFGIYVEGSMALATCGLLPLRQLASRHPAANTQP